MGDALLQTDENPLADYYQAFQVSSKVLLTGHSHQAWPDCSQNGQLAAWHDAAQLIDDKWSAALKKAEQVRSGFGQLMSHKPEEIVLGQNTHELIVRFLSNLDFSKRIKIVTTDSEFHSLRRQLQRLQEMGVEIHTVPCQPINSLADRLIESIDKDTTATMVSAVFFNSGQIFQDVGEVALHCHSKDIPCLVDAYHALNAIEFNLLDWKLDTAFVVGGGYKYCQLGEGNCFLRLPNDHQGRPIITGWFAEFHQLDQRPGKIGYGPGQSAYDGSTYDPTSHYRAVEVFDFFKEQELNPSRLRKISQQQIQYLLDGLSALDLAPSQFKLPQCGIENIAGFLSIEVENAPDWVEQLKHRSIYTDSRGNQLRFGPAPYLSLKQLDIAIQAIEEIASDIRS